MIRDPFIETESDNKVLIAIFASAILLIYIAFGLIISKGGLRGSDQYWYVADTESLLNGDGVQTNNIFAFNVLNDSIVKNKGFIHNVPQIYFASIPGKLFGAFNGWLIMNAFFSVGTAILFFYTLKKFLPFIVSGLIALQFLVMPLTFWQSYQPLAESFQGLLTTSILFVYYSNQKVNRYYLLLILSVLLLLCRNNYILTVPIISILYYYEIRNKNKLLISTLYSILYTTLILVFYFIFKSLLPDTWNFSFYDTLVTSKVGVLNSSTFIELVKIYFNNLVAFFSTQFLTISFTAIFYFPYNLFIIGTAILWLIGKNFNFNTSIFLIIFSFLFLLFTTIIFQNQPRYMLPFYTIVMFGFFIQIKHTFKSNSSYNLVSKSLIFTIIISLLINSFITYKLINEGKSENAIREYYSNIYNKTIPDNESIIFYEENFNYLLHGYILRPRKIFIGSENTYLNTDRYSTLIDKNKIKWLITKSNLGQKMKLKYYSLELNEILNIYGSLSKVYIYTITKNSSVAQ
jgi:hypothetical protein